MARRATGRVIEPDEKQKSYALRFTAYGKRRFITLGRPEDGWTLTKAETELRNVLADVDRGRWTPQVAAPEPTVAEIPTFHEFASEWIARREPELAENTLIDYRWALIEHLLPVFAEYPVNGIDIRAVDNYKVAKAREGRLSNNSINRTITVLSMVLADAVEYGIIAANPAAGRRRRLKRETPSRPYIEPEQLPALLDAAQALDGEYQPVARPILATLAIGGLRISEALDLEWRDVNLSTRTLKVRESKTEAGVREVDLSTSLADDLATLKAARRKVGKRDPVFGSYHYHRADKTRPAKLDRHRVRERILKPAVKAANKILDDAGIETIEKLTLHGLRRTCATIRLAAGDEPIYVTEQLGHTDPTFTMRIYARAVKRRVKLSGETLKAFDQALQLAEIGRIGAVEEDDRFSLKALEGAESASEAGYSERARQDSNLRPHAPEARSDGYRRRTLVSRVAWQSREQGRAVLSACHRSHRILPQVFPICSLTGQKVTPRYG